MRNCSPRPSARPGAVAQRGAATLFVTLMILVILTLIVLSSSSVALFEQKTATNEYRARLAEQAAEYALNLGGEFLKVNVSKLSTNVTGGWLNASSLRWRSCAGVTATGHPCLSEQNPTRRAQLYYYTSDGAAHTTASSADLTAMDLFNTGANAAALAASLSTIGGTSSFPATANVYALMCRIDTSAGLATDDRCRLSPAQGRRIAITLISQASLTGENSAATVRETWGTISSDSFSASTPLVASGSVGLVGTFTIVDAPNAGGYGIGAAVWSAQDAGGTGSWQTCQMEDYLGSHPIAELYTDPGCGAITPSTCHCNAEIVSEGGDPDGIDILDKDSGNGVNPDITFFPGSSDFSTQALRDSTRMDYRLCTGAGTPHSDCVTAGQCPTSHPYCLTDDNLFEWIFGRDVTNGDTTIVQTNCSVPAAFQNATNATDCEVAALADMNFQPIPNCQAANLNENSAGLFYVTGTCDLGANSSAPIIGDPSHPVILVIDNDVDFGKTDNFFGMMFVRSAPAQDAADGLNHAEITGNANGKFFGSIVLEGTATHLNGTMDLIYMDTSAGNPNDPLPETTRFARLPNSWLDNVTGF
jgi:hypothetical protein